MSRFIDAEPIENYEGWLDGTCLVIPKDLVYEAPTVEVLNELTENTWHDLRKDKNDLPTEDGWYDCWIRLTNKNGEIYVNYGMDLYYYTDSKKFIDNRRQDVFNIYDVMAFDPDTRVPFDKKKIYKDDCCDRTDGVIAWKEMDKFID